MKINTAGAIVWDVPAIKFEGFLGSALGVFAGPVISGRQLIYVQWAQGGGQVSTIAQAGMTGVDKEGFPTGPYTTVNPGQYGNVSSIGFDRFGQPQILANYDDGISQFVTTSSGSSIPGAKTAYGFFDPITNAWIVKVVMNNTFNEFIRSYDPSSGAINWSFSATPDANTEIIPQLLPGGHVALLVNSSDNATPPKFSHRLTVIDVYGNVLWTSPFGTMNPGLLNMVSASDFSSPIYAVSAMNPPIPSGRPAAHLELYNWTGTQLLSTDWQPIGDVFPTTDGFYDLFNWEPTSSVFLEHYLASAKTYDWGRRFSSSDLDAFPDGIVQGPNSFYVVGRELTRYVAGTCIQSLSGPSSFTGGQPLQVMINMNQEPADGSNIVVSLHSYSPNVKMPNGTFDEDFVVVAQNAGQKSFPVTLITAVANGTPYKVAISAIQNGVRCVLYCTGS